MKIARRFTQPDMDVHASVEWTTRSSRITGSDGGCVFEMADAEVPRDWSQLATDIMLSKYFRKAGVPQMGRDGRPLMQDGKPVLGPERSVRQVVNRLAGCWRVWGERYGYFDSQGDAQAFQDEISWMLLTQAAAPNSPQWFNTGLNMAYGINGPAQGHFIADHKSGATRLAPDAYSHPQPHACFIQSVRDDLVGESGIMDLWTREARLFKYGSGTGTNFSDLRGADEPLSGGGRSSGLMSFLKIGDRAAGAIKSGGTTRRAAKMVCLDVNHPDIEAFVTWKVREELKVAAMVEGLKHLPQEQRELAAQLGLELDYDFNGEAYFTVSGQNSNNSVRVNDEFFDAVDSNADWELKRRTDGAVARTVKARELWTLISQSAWRCADPGVQFDSTINAWHTCPAGGRINASNPCSEYMFLDNTACNLASINLLKFYDAEARSFDIAGYEHAIDLWTIVLEISVVMAAFPSKEIAELSWRYRTLGLGYANLGALLMQAGVPYDSEAGRAICGALTSILTGRSYAQSALLAKELGAFSGYAANRDSMLRVIRNHRRAAHGLSRQSNDWEELRIRPVPLDHSVFTDGRVGLSGAADLLGAACRAWDSALSLGERFGYRNAQVTVIAPTGTIGLLMDCDTTGVEPDYALTKFKKLAGGGSFKIANQSIRPSLRALGYSANQVDEILRYVMGSLSLDTAMPQEDGTGTCGLSLRDYLLTKQYSSEDLVSVENQLPTLFELRRGFIASAIPARAFAAIGVDQATAERLPAFDGLRALGLTAAQCNGLNRRICGTQTIEGAPHIREEHLAVFDCAARCGPNGTRFIAPEGHIRMMAACQPFVSGAISKTINLPNDATVEQIGDSYRLSWELGLKANALYRDGCKLSQPLSTKTDVAAAPEAVAAPIEPAVRVVERIVEVDRIVERVVERPIRRRLPDTRRSLIHKFNVGGHEGYLIVGMYDDGRPGELFITMAKEGSTIGGLMDSLGTAISVALQYGVPIESMVRKFEFQRFEPMGMTSNDDIPFAKSLVDYIFRWMGMQFLVGYRETHAPQRGHGSAAQPANVKEDNAWKNHTAPPSLSPAPGSGVGVPERTAASWSVAAPTNPVLEVPARAAGETGVISTSSTRVEETVTDLHGHLHTERVTRTVNDQAMSVLQLDAPPCDSCGSITRRNGACYVCPTCGQSAGCS